MPGYAPRLFTGGQLDYTYNCTVIQQTNGVLALWPIRFYLISVFKKIYIINIILIYPKKNVFSENLNVDINLKGMFSKDICQS